MTPEIIGGTGIILLLALLLLRIPVAVAMGLVGFLGYSLLNGFQNALQITGMVPFEVATSDALAQLPLFILMGDLAVRSGMSGRLFEATSRIFVGLRGSLAMATIGASAGFGAISGSSLATAATMTKIAMPAMRNAGYDDKLSSGSIAAGGTMGILIPPSIAMVVYAITAEQSVPQLYAASMVPSILLFAFYILVVVVQVTLRPERAPNTKSGFRLSDRLAALTQIWEVVLLFTVVVGGIYSGVFTPTEAAAVGVFGAWLLGALSRRLSLRETLIGVGETVKITAMLFLIMVSANIFTYFVVFTHLPQAVIGLVQGLGLEAFGIMLCLVVFYLILGCFLEAFGIVLITVPIILPLVVEVGYDPIWFGVFLVVVIEMGLITPPVGMNIFVMKAQFPLMPVTTLYRGALPYLLALLVLLILLIFFPSIAMWLPNHLFPSP